MSGPVQITRDGKVTVNARLVGYVDRWDHRSNRRTPCRTWRWVGLGGQVPVVRYATRAEAVQALLAETHHCSPMGTNARGVAQCSEGHGDYPDACDLLPTDPDGGGIRPSSRLSEQEGSI